MSPVYKLISAVAAIICMQPVVHAQSDDGGYVDATDPTKIQTYAGLGIKYSDYTNGESMTELRLVGNVGLSEHDMLLFEVGYGWHDGDLEPGTNQTITDARLHYFHLWDMNYEKRKGYRGLGLSVDLQIAGRLKGTDGQNLLSFGAMPVFALGGFWDLYLTVGAVATWDKGWTTFNGAGVNLSPQLIYSPDNWWQGAQIQITPTYNYFLTGELKNEGGGDLLINIGGNISQRLVWDINYQQNVDIDFGTFRRGEDTGLENDWNVFVNVTSYF